jgi:hypothetical protein
MRVVINPEAENVLAIAPAFRSQLIAALEAADFSDVCILDGSGTEAEPELILKCPGRRALTIPVTSFSNSDVLDRMLQRLR